MNIGIIGAGSWGIALASVLSDNGHNVLLLAHKEEIKAEINNNHTLYAYAPTVKLSKCIKATTSYEELLKFSSTLVLVTPSKAISEVMSHLKDLDFQDGTLIIATKGLVGKKTITTYIDELMDVKSRKINLVVLSGPSFSRYVLSKKITCVTVASTNNEKCLEVSKLFHNVYFRVYLSNDVNGVEFCGGFKNVIALGAGLLDGYEEGSNARAALISRGLYEMSKYSKVFQIEKETLYGLAGVGDLVLTATDMTSRNYSLGHYLGKGYSLEEALKIVKTTAESIVTVKDLYEISQEYAIDSPIISSIYAIVYLNTSPREELDLLMSRTIKSDN